MPYWNDVPALLIVTDGPVPFGVWNSKSRLYWNRNSFTVLGESTDVSVVMLDSFFTPSFPFELTGMATTVALCTPFGDLKSRALKLVDSLWSSLICQSTFPKPRY